MIPDQRTQRGMWAPGGYYRICQKCNNEFSGDKKALICANCAYSIDSDNLGKKIAEVFKNSRPMDKEERASVNKFFMDQFKEPSDMQKFIDLYKSFGILLKSEPSEPYRERPDAAFRIKLEADLTTDSKFNGYNGFYSDVLFDKDGKFISQEFWE